MATRRGEEHDATDREAETDQCGKQLPIPTRERFVDAIASKRSVTARAASATRSRIPAVSELIALASLPKRSCLCAIPESAPGLTSRGEQLSRHS